MQHLFYSPIRICVVFSKKTSLLAVHFLKNVLTLQNRKLKTSIIYLFQKKNIMALEIEGKLFEVFDTAAVTDKFQKREFVLELENGNYKEYPKFQLTQARCSLLDEFQKNDEVKVHFNLAGRPYQGRNGQTIYFTNLNVWKIEALQTQQAATEVPPHTEADIPYNMDEEDNNDDFPF